MPIDRRSGVATARPTDMKTGEQSGRFGGTRPTPGRGAEPSAVEIEEQRVVSHSGRDPARLSSCPLCITTTLRAAGASLRNTPRAGPSRATTTALARWSLPIATTVVPCTPRPCGRQGEGQAQAGGPLGAERLPISLAAAAVEMPASRRWGAMQRDGAGPGRLAQQLKVLQSVAERRTRQQEVKTYQVSREWMAGL